MTASLHSQFGPAAKPRERRKAPPRPISIRVTAEERAHLEREAGDQTLSAFVRSRIFDKSGVARRKNQRPELDQVALARILALLGQSGIKQNLTAIVEAIRTGTLEAGPELRGALEQAAVDVMLMRHDLIRALGVKPE
jgi:hypothetical protein